MLRWEGGAARTLEALGGDDRPDEVVEAEDEGERGHGGAVVALRDEQREQREAERQQRVQQQLVDKPVDAEAL